MDKISIVPGLIELDEIKLFDSRKLFPVSICEKSDTKFNRNYFKRPFILVNNFDRNKNNEEEIERVSLEYLEKVGLRIVSLKTKKLRIRKNYKSQRVIYLLESLGRVIPNSEVVTHIPVGHFIELDIANNRIRLKGRDAFPYRRADNATPWVEIDE